MHTHHSVIEALFHALEESVHLLPYLFITYLILEYLEKRTENIYVAKRAYFEKVIKSYSDGYVESDGEYFNQPIIAFGDVAIVGFPYELFAGIGIKIKDAKVFEKTLVFALCNGGNGYFPTHEEIQCHILYHKLCSLLKYYFHYKTLFHLL